MKLQFYSSGSAGRPWTSVTFEVEVLPQIDITSSMDDITNFVRNISQIDYPLHFPSKFLYSERNYIFTVTVCNFVNLCSIGSRSVHINAYESPIAYLTGVDPQVIKANEALVVKAMPQTVNLTDASSLAYSR